MDGPWYLPLDGADAAPGLAVIQARCGHLDDASAGPRLAVARSQDVLDPVAVRAVCHGQDATFVGCEDIDRRLVLPPGTPATVGNYAETGINGAIRSAP